MSLKAKLEAVIYAAEEPVTLAQLSILFAADALEWKAEREASSLPEAEDGASAAELLPRNGEFTYRQQEDPLADKAPAGGEDAAEAEPATAIEPGPESAMGTAPAPPVDEEAEGRRLARQRDRDTRAILRQIIEELITDYVSDSRGIEIREIAGGYRMATKPECHDAVRLFVKSLKPALRLSLPALETLAVVAYKQPVTAPEVNEIRGVDSSGVFGSLLARKLIATAGRKQVIGRPILYKTTREFLLRFGLKDVSELPSMEEFEKMAAIELDEPEPAGQPYSGSDSGTASALDFDEAASEEFEDAPADQATAGPTPATHAESTPAEAAPAAPPQLQQAEKENSPHDQ